MTLQRLNVKQWSWAVGLFYVVEAVGWVKLLGLLQGWYSAVSLMLPSFQSEDQCTYAIFSSSSWIFSEIRRESVQVFFLYMRIKKIEKMLLYCVGTQPVVLRDHSWLGWGDQMGVHTIIVRRSAVCKINSMSCPLYCHSGSKKCYLLCLRNCFYLSYHLINIIYQFNLCIWFVDTDFMN